MRGGMEEPELYSTVMGGHLPRRYRLFDQGGIIPISFGLQQMIAAWLPGELEKMREVGGNVCTATCRSTST